MSEHPRKQRRRLAPVLAVIVGLGAALGGLAAWQTWFQPELRPGFSLPDLQDDEQRSISEWDGDLIVLNFWATWCPPCVKEIPVFTALQDEYGEQGVQFIGVAIDNRDDALSFYDELDMNYPSFYGVQEAMDINEAYGNEMGTLPYTVLIDRNGAIVHRFNREVDRDDIEPVIQEHL
ncbi:TlpA family protein disulfide reductase [Aquisalimonas asiatica]|uniref:Peroxiredoxin n=1 Tax=Aquisalimonas asiatica TaxID=406100 RepID=A0A1H8V659_9GAMM|nr:TlpA disulfide reductase family protein [Aquisalimonas asiatica]SEP10767.1 Peroxiredoxin [Aquisalimonas asiatica]